MHVTRSFLHYWRWHGALALGAALAAMAIMGSLFVGDSVKDALAEKSAKRLQRVTHAVSCGDGFLSLNAAQRLKVAAAGSVVAPVLVLPGTVAVAGGGTRANGVMVHGVDSDFWKLGNAAASANVAAGLRCNAALAKRLGVKAGDELILRIEKPSLISRDAPLSGETDATAVLTEKIIDVVADDALGALSLAAEQTDALNLFLPLEQMAKAVEALRNGVPNVNLILADGPVEEKLRATGAWNLEDVNLDVQAESGTDYLQLKTGRVFLADGVQAAATAAGLKSEPMFTYLATELRADPQRYTAYPLVCGLPANFPLLAQPLKGNEMAINAWTAESLKLKPGDAVSVSYYRVTEARSLKEETAKFTIREILPMEAPLLNASLTPDFPGFSQAASCRDWKPGIPIKQQGFIRREDEQYWQQRKGTPKAFISLEKAQSLWKNRFGQATSLWFKQSDADLATVKQKLRDGLSLNALGFVFVAPGAAAQAAVSGSMDFGGLFLAMSFFLIGTALVLVALLFLYNVESRAGQVGLLRACGFTASYVRNAFLKEFSLALILGALAGIPLAKCYQAGILQRLSGDWGGAVGGLQFRNVVSTGSIVNGVGMTVVMGLLVLWWMSRRLNQTGPAKLLAGGSFDSAEKPNRGSKRSTLRFWGGILAIAIAGGLAPQAAQMDRQIQPAVFFGAAALLLMGGILLLGDWLEGLEKRSKSIPRSTWALGLRQAVRRRGRSLAVAGLLAAGVFMVAAMNTMHAEVRSADHPGVGGFAFLGTSDLPIYEDLNSKEGQELYGLEDLPVSFVPMRKRVGEEASCLNLNKAQVPSVLGVSAAKIAAEAKFEFSGIWSKLDTQGITSPWQLLDKPLESGCIPAVVDMNSAMWALKKSLGDTVEVPNGKGGVAKLQLVAFLKNTMLQGHVIISETSFASEFPDTAGYKMFLIKAPAAGREAIATKLTRQMQNRGLAVQPAVDRLGELMAVQNTYLKIFSALGGLGLLLSTVALGLLIGRNVLERKGELALMSASGFTRAKVRQVVLGEFLPLFGIAFILGLASTALAIWPHVRDGTGAVPTALLVQVLGGLAVCGIGFCVIAAWWALRKPTLQALRQE